MPDLVRIVRETDDHLVAIIRMCPTCSPWPVEHYNVWLDSLCEDCLENLMALLRPEERLRRQ
jgi:hypothetical protein